MFISVTLPATHHCLKCDSLFHDPKVTYERKGRYYYRREKCPYCKSEKIEAAAEFRISGRYKKYA